ncbi:uncharacterized protein F5891DRAFT_1186131 [Suillus fuscotomentosus]|uniref:Uncharacterized protein n=1 Tax=Suillus fuscotomentosus TaxID=1912939 RepID=A0AAD4HMD2_9AGAM|nr:uncharacterized protein F5891DRAFT_1186131 [Suillus fuscotomentosus]KAG1902985.1 hypothetical protein F5891DRAFT_1186131 [Suillus fuscotomentosus]
MPPTSVDSVSNPYDLDDRAETLLIAAGLVEAGEDDIVISAYPSRGYTPDSQHSHDYYPCLGGNAHVEHTDAPKQLQELGPEQEVDSSGKIRPLKHGIQGSAVKKVKLSITTTATDISTSGMQVVPAPTQAAADASSSSNGFFGATSASSSSCDHALPSSGTAPVLQPSTELQEPSILHEQSEPSIPISTPGSHDIRPTRSHRLPMQFRDEPPVPPPAIPQPAPSTLV